MIKTNGIEKNAAEEGEEQFTAFFADAEEIEDEFEESKGQPEPLVEAVEEKGHEELFAKLTDESHNFAPFNTFDDWRRPHDTDSYGGFLLKDKDIQNRLRSAGKEMIKAVGKKILSGSFNLTTISFPIKCMCAQSMLDSMATMAVTYPYYLNKAAFARDPVERLKFVMVSSMSFLLPAHQFEKPLNPVLGETIQRQLDDGTECYFEQTCHHPPVSSFLFYGPGHCYTLSGWSSFSAKAWMNSAQLTVSGHKKITFLDGTTITYNSQGDNFNSILMGTINH